MPTKENELCRQGKLFCSICNKPMEMYYTPQCFWCNKPTGKVYVTYNLICVLKYLEHKKEGTKDIIWGLLCNIGEIGMPGLQNDTFGYVFMPFEDYTNLTEKQSEALQLLFEHYPNANEKLWEINW